MRLILITLPSLINILRVMNGWTKCQVRHQQNCTVFYNNTSISSQPGFERKYKEFADRKQVHGLGRLQWLMLVDTPTFIWYCMITLQRVIEGENICHVLNFKCRICVLAGCSPVQHGCYQQRNLQRSQELCDVVDLCLILFVPIPITVSMLIPLKIVSIYVRHALASFQKMSSVTGAPKWSQVGPLFFPMTHILNN